MRFVPIHCIREGAVLAKPLYGLNGEVLLKVNTVLKDAYISRIAQLGMQGLYIADALSEDLEITSAITEELRMKAIKNLRDAFMQATKSADTKSSAENTLRTAESIVDEILEHRDVMNNIVDIKVYDNYTFYHSLNVTVLSTLVGIGLNYSREKLAKLAYAALLHDVGKVFIDQSVINKSGRLTEEEYAVVKRHPGEGYIYLREKYAMTEISARGVLEHHERYDGNGYPSQKKGKEISEFGRIIAVADVYDALVSDRSYRKGMFATEAMEYLLGGSGSHFDPDVVRVFSQKVALFPAGTCVMLSNGEVALIMKNFQGFAQRPLVRVFMRNEQYIDPFILDLCHDYNTLDITVVAAVAM